MAQNNEFRKIVYYKKGDLDLSRFEVEAAAQAVIDSCEKDEDLLVLRLRINSPVVIEAAAPLTQKGIREIASI